MEYVELKCAIGQGQEQLAEQLMAILGELGFESFIEENNALLAYIPTSQFDASILTNKELWPENADLSLMTWQRIPEQNWNAVWEENFQPVTISNRCHIRAPFHPEISNIDYQIIIEPKMSFGTAHHETTAMMIQYLLEKDFQNKKVLDMGCGTGVLAILAALKGSNEVTAIDNDEWAYNNTLENIQRNNTPFINVYLGDASLLNGQVFNVIIANINRNILLNDIPAYVKCLNDGGLLLLSGFYIEDLDTIKECTAQSGLIFNSYKEDNRWVAACFEK